MTWSVLRDSDDTYRAISFEDIYAEYALLRSIRVDLGPSRWLSVDAALGTISVRTGGIEQVFSPFRPLTQPTKLFYARRSRSILGMNAHPVVAYVLGLQHGRARLCCEVAEISQEIAFYKEEGEPIS